MRIKTGLLWVFILIILSPFLAYWVSQAIPGYDGFVVTSGSMEPEIQTGSLLFTRPLLAEKITVGDTITFQEDGGYTTHKVVEKNISGTEISFVTKGVNNDSPDPGTVSPEEITGVKILSIPLLGYVTAWAGTTKGFIGMVVVPAVLIILIELKELYIKIKSFEQA